jgi:hypothetical protein
LIFQHFAILWAAVKFFAIVACLYLADVNSGFWPGVFCGIMTSGTLFCAVLCIFGSMDEELIEYWIPEIVLMVSYFGHAMFFPEFLSGGKFRDGICG